MQTTWKSPQQTPKPSKCSTCNPLVLTRMLENKAWFGYNRALSCRWCRGLLTLVFILLPLTSHNPSPFQAPRLGPAWQPIGPARGPLRHSAGSRLGRLDEDADAGLWGEVQDGPLPGLCPRQAAQPPERVAEWPNDAQSQRVSDGSRSNQLKPVILLFPAARARLFFIILRLMLKACLDCVDTSEQPAGPRRPYTRTLRQATRRTTSYRT